MLESFESIDPAILTNVVRQDQRNPEFEVLDWNNRADVNRGNMIEATTIV